MTGVSADDRAVWRVPRHLDGELRLAMFSVDEFLLITVLLYGGILSGRTMWTVAVVIVGIPLLRKAKARLGGGFSLMALLYWFTPVHVGGFPPSWKRYWHG